MKCKAEVIRGTLPGLRVLDIGGSGYGEDNAYERDLRQAWSLTQKRLTIDHSDRADFTCDLNALPIPSPPAGEWDITTAFDVLEHLEHPVDVLRWIPTDRLLVSLPNALSPLARRMEERGGSGHLYSFTPYTASVMLQAGGWVVDASYFTFGKWSVVAKLINLAGSLWPSRVGTGMMLHCHKAPSPDRA